MVIDVHAELICKWQYTGNSDSRKSFHGTAKLKSVNFFRIKKLDNKTSGNRVFSI